MLKALIDFLLNRKGHPVQKDSTTASEQAAPYKVETPAPESKVEVKSDSGTWPFPTPVGSEEKTVKPAVRAKSTRTKKAPVAAITAAEKPAAKKPARPRAKKAKE
jgi:hypothetical protein